jgi:hypothetical protein
MVIRGVSFWGCPGQSLVQAIVPAFAGVTFCNRCAIRRCGLDGAGGLAALAPHGAIADASPTLLRPP